MTLQNTVYETALNYHQSGLSVLPVIPGKKAPSLGANHAILRRERVATAEELAQWFDRNTPAGIAVQCGLPSGNLECLDFEDETLFEEWVALVKTEMTTLPSRLCVVRTPRPGRHVWYHHTSTEVPGSTKLAAAPDGSTLIETRGEGAYALVPGGPDNAHPSGRPYVWLGPAKLTDPPGVCPEEREVMTRCARALNRYPGKTERTGLCKTPTPIRRHRPWVDEFENTTTWDDLLTPAGWECVRESGETRFWRRPGKGEGQSATTGHCCVDGVDLLHVFSSNAAPFQMGKSYSKFLTLALLHFNGDCTSTANSLRGRQKRLGEVVADAHRDPSALCFRAQEVITKPAEFLWENWFPVGAVSFLDGHPGLGKSTVLTDLAARVTRGAKMPDGSTPVQGGVILISGEDDPEVTIRPRLELAGADLSRVGIIDPEWRNQQGGIFTLPDDVDILDEMVREYGARLVVIDPLSEYLSMAYSPNNDQHVRQALEPLRRLAKRRGCAVILLRHLNKAGGTNAMLRGLGSVGLTGVARAQHVILNHPEWQPTDGYARGILAWSKCNIAPWQQGCAYALREEPGTRVCRVEWLERWNLHANDLLMLLEEKTKSKK